MPLADRIRPKTLDEIVGQTHLIAKGKPLRNIILSGEVPNMIFYGPSGIGKTTLADIIASATNRRLHRLNATTAGVADIKAIIAELDTMTALNGVLLYLDEIQYFNKKQQQSLLQYIESGRIALIASTTENPYFYVYNAILSRSTIFEFKPPKADEIVPAVERAFNIFSKERGEELELEDGVCRCIAGSCGGDVRKAINAVELCVLSSEIINGKRLILLDTAREMTQKSSMRYDADGDEHYDILSAFQKSLRGSDPDAALHYLARLLEAGDLQSACRRLLVCAFEDVGLANPDAAVFVKSAVDSAFQLGLPEASIPLADAVTLVALSPKSNSAIEAYGLACADIHAGNIGDIPTHLRDAHYSGAKKMGRGTEYMYPHSYPNHYIKQQYLPDLLKDRQYYSPADNKYESAAKAYRFKLGIMPENEE